MSNSRREQKRTSLYGKIQHLRSVTHSTSVNKTSIIVDASKYIEELKDKVERLEESSSHGHEYSLPIEVSVETLKRGFLINVYSDRNCPGLLVSVLEAFDELGLDVLDAKVSCSDNFHLEVVGGENEEQKFGVDAQGVKQAVLEAIKKWSESNNDEQE
ncbi:transcription factor SCREAM2-like [Impatiens glandulifera]|uniref:transcription factor SCREAM2-like n=1 Tax=Impatiens glandulifera TaxID=253017 RepID=UPI001FB0F071|nr:transcription factor SCREAM2-like [Impatiens glandulifera]